MLSKLQLKRRFLAEKIDPSSDEKVRVANVAEVFHEFAAWLNNELPDGRPKSLALTNLETSIMWAVKSITTEDSYPDPNLPSIKNKNKKGYKKP